MLVYEKYSSNRYEKRLKEVNDMAKENLTDSHSSDEENFLGHNKNFQMTFKRPSLDEKRILEEDELVETISLMNDYFKGDSNYRSEFLKYFSENSAEDEDDNLSHTESYSTLDNSALEDIIKKNVQKGEGVIKLLLVGDKGVGKTTFKNLLKNFRGENETKQHQEKFKKLSHEVIQPTASLEITKINYSGFALEIFDTNVKILASPLIKSKLINKLINKLILFKFNLAYLKICNAFVLVSDKTRIETLKFLDKQMENIINFSSNPKNIFFISNENLNVNTFNPFNNSKTDNENYLHYLAEKFDLPIYFNSKSKITALPSFQNFTAAFDKFLLNCLMRKKSKSCPSQKFNPLALKKDFYTQKHKKNLINYFLKFNSN